MSSESTSLKRSFSTFDDNQLFSPPLKRTKVVQYRSRVKEIYFGKILEKYEDIEQIFGHFKTELDQWILNTNSGKTEYRNAVSNGSIQNLKDTSLKIQVSDVLGWKGSQPKPGMVISINQKNKNDEDLEKKLTALATIKQMILRIQQMTDELDLYHHSIECAKPFPNLINSHNLTVCRPNEYTGANFFSQTVFSKIYSPLAELAERNYKEKKFDKAKEYAKEEINRNPTNSLMRQLMAKINLFQGNHELAEFWLETIETPPNINHCHLYALLDYLKKDPEMAKQRLESFKDKMIDDIKSRGVKNYFDVMPNNILRPDVFVLFVIQKAKIGIREAKNVEEMLELAKELSGVLENAHLFEPIDVASLFFLRGQIYFILSMPESAINDAQQALRIVSQFEIVNKEYSDQESFKINYFIIQVKEVQNAQQG